MLEWTPEAIADINGIVEYLFEYDPEFALAVSDEIVKRCAWLSIHSMEGNRVEGLHRDYKQDYAIKKKYRVYYYVLEFDHIKILMIRGNRRRTPTTQEIKERV